MLPVHPVLQLLPVAARTWTPSLRPSVPSYPGSGTLRDLDTRMGQSRANIDKVLNLLIIPGQQ